jgi:hypothetical protein
MTSRQGFGIKPLWPIHGSRDTEGTEHFRLHKRYNSVAISTRLRSEQQRSRGSIPGRGNRFVSTPQRPGRLWPTQRPIQWVLVVLSPGVNRLRSATNHSTPYIVVVNNVCSYTSTTLCFHGFMHRDDFNVTFRDLIEIQPSSSEISSTIRHTA